MLHILMQKNGQLVEANKHFVVNLYGVKERIGKLDQAPLQDGLQNACLYFIDLVNEQNNLLDMLNELLPNNCSLSSPIRIPMIVFVSIVVVVYLVFVMVRYYKRVLEDYALSWSIS